LTTLSKTIICWVCAR